jgi:dihydroceramidase
VAETWNTLSNVMLFLPCVLYGFPMCNTFNLPLRFKISFALLALVGVGSWCFHMTLLHVAQVGGEEAGGWRLDAHAPHMTTWHSMLV